MHRTLTQRITTQGPSWAPVAAVAAANVFLATGPLFVRLADTGPVAAAFWRIALAAPVLLVAAALLGERPVRAARGLWGAIALAGLAFALDLGSWHVGILGTTLANSTLFGNSATLIYPIYGFIVARAWPTRMQGAALTLAALGGGLLLGRSAELSPQNLVGDLFCLLAGVLYAAYFIIMARVRTAMRPLSALGLSTAASALPLLALALILGERVMPGDWTPLLLLTLCSQLIGQGLLIYAIGHLTPLVVGLALLIQPVVSATIGWLWFDERLGLPDIAGAVLIAAALVLVRKPEGKPLAPEAADPRSVA
ncbi:EamA family transporter [Sphingomonas spermidinifaciens]|uniref:EamA family transporter n=1 Tax=Sphingomonas spermidinifaciens TaxID=1141889 RepID=A0A2A4B3R3_9SPHN|nr:DMT family transporter [Sphingomonas spermidinifaciens]PCD02324.1 EamA family transporter [Sphingomonas spermidinifaciens]